MKYIKLFDTVSSLNSAISSTTIDFIGMSRDNGTVKIGKTLPQHEWIEIGGIKWATMNVGANTIYEPGLFYQWGDTQGYTAAQIVSKQKSCTSSSYKWTNDNGQTFTKYNSTDNKLVLDIEDDAVHAAWGGNWRSATYSDFKALLAATDEPEVVQDYNDSGVNGLLFTDKSDSSKTLFIPFGGGTYYGELVYPYSTSYIWLPLLSEGYTSHGRMAAWDGEFVYETNLEYYSMDRWEAANLRGVLDV